MSTEIYRGSTIRGKIQLRTKDPVNPELENQYFIPVGAVVEVTFPGDLATVVLSTANVGEVNIIDAEASTVAFVMAPAKSNLLKISTDEELATVNAIVTDNSVSPATIDIFEKAAVYIIKDKANP